MAITQDTVFLGAMRPALLWGTHWGAVIANVVITLYAFVFTGSLWALALWIPLHSICWLMSRFDPHAFRLLGLFIWMRADTLGAQAYWRASSSSPHPKRRY